MSRCNLLHRRHPDVGEQLERPHPVFVAMRRRRHHEFVDAIALDQLGQLRADIGGSAEHCASQSAVEERPFLGGERRAVGLFGSGHRTRSTLPKSKEAECACAGEEAGFLEGGGAEHLHTDHCVGGLSPLRGAEVVPVQLKCLDRSAHAEMVGEGERPPELPGDLGAPVAAAEHPETRHVSCAGHS